MTRFDWDDQKNLSNERKHGITFQQASSVFNDPNVVSKLDRIVDGEQRWHTTGLRRTLLLLIVHTIEEEKRGGRSYSSHLGPHCDTPGKAPL